LPLLDRLSDMIAAADAVVVITGRSVLAEAFAARCAPKPLHFLPIPVEYQFRTGPDRRRHFPECFERILSELARDLSGTLCLIGAGIFGKAYCLAAKHAGGVAVDLGSAFDVLAGLNTRPIHGTPELVETINLEALRWL
jgi:hypothetical protein